MWLYGWGCLFDLTACAKNLCAIVVVGIIVCTEPTGNPWTFPLTSRNAFLQTRSRHEAEVARFQQTNMECWRPDLLGCKIRRNEIRWRRRWNQATASSQKPPTACQYMYSDPDTQAAGMCLASLTQSLPRNLQVSFHSDPYLVSKKKKKKKKKKKRLLPQIEKWPSMHMRMEVLLRPWRRHRPRSSVATRKTTATLQPGILCDRNLGLEGKPTSACGRREQLWYSGNNVSSISSISVCFKTVLQLWSSEKECDSVVGSECSISRPRGCPDWTLAETPTRCAR